MEFQILGTLRATVGDQRIDLRGARSEAILAALVLEAGRTVPIEDLIRFAWDEHPPATARRQVRNRVTALRRLLVTAGFPQEVIQAEGHGFALHPGQALVDLLAFHGYLTRAQELRNTDAPGAVALLRQALALWRGPALAGLEGKRLLAAAARLDELRLSTWEQCFSLELELGRHHEALAELAYLVGGHPTHEPLISQLMLAYYRSGRQADALRLYADTRKHLANEFGIDPGAELRDRFARILRNDPSLRLRVLNSDQSPAAPEVADQAIAVGTAPSFVPRQLPGSAGGFVGRVEELAWLERTDGGVLVMSGAAGVGKTALAVHWAHRVADRYPDGQLYLNLRGFGVTPLTPAQALGTLLLGLGVPADRMPVDVGARAGLYRTVLADRRVLILLDNALDAHQVYDLLPGTPSCLVLVTSRQAMSGLIARVGARRLRLNRLRPADARALLAAVLGEARVKAEEQAAAELARLCACLPLALRVAAANLADRPQVPLALYAGELASGDRLAALAVNGDGNLAVGAALDVSYQELDPGTRRLFRRLGLFPGPDFGVQVAAVLDAEPAAATAARLAELAAAHLVETVGPDRYALHDLLRLYAAQRAAAEESPTAVVEDRLAEWYLATAVNAVEVIRSGRLRLPDRLRRHDVRPVTFDSGAAALAWLDAERDGLLAVARGSGDDIAWYLLDALGGYLMLRSGQVDWVDLAASGLAIAGAAGDPAGQMAMYSSLGLAWWSRGEGCALQYFQRARELARAIGDRRWETTMGLSMGMLHRDAGSLGPAAEHLSEALAGYEALGDKQMVARTHKSLGILHRAAGRLADAAASLHAAAEWYRDVGDDLRYAEVLGSLGNVHRDRGELAEAAGCLRVALEAYRKVDQGPGQASMLVALATVHLAGGDAELAAATARDAGEVAARVGYRRFEGHALVTLAAAEHALRTGPAEEHARQALLIAREGPFGPLEVQALTVLADLAACRSEPVQAIELAGQAVAKARSEGYRLLEGNAYVVLGRAQRADGDRFAADRSDQAARQIFFSIGVPDGVRDCPSLSTADPRN